jgi:transposase
MTSRGAEKMNNDTIGVDVSKDHLDAYRLADGAARRFANDKGGHKALIKWLAQTPLNRVVFEPTGPYHRAVERALGASGVPFVKVNPRQARRFAEATGKLAKTDRLDAAILARMGALLELQGRPAPSEVLLELKELYVAREALVKDRTAARNRGKVLTLPLLKRHNAQRLEQIDRQIATVEAEILQIVEADAGLSDRLAILTSIPGLSNITAFALLIEMPELGSLDAGLISAFLEHLEDDRRNAPVTPQCPAGGHQVLLPLPRIQAAGSPGAYPPRPGDPVQEDGPASGPLSPAAGAAGGARRSGSRHARRRPRPGHAASGGLCGPPRSRRSALATHLHRLNAVAQWKAAAGIAA